MPCRSGSAHVQSLQCRGTSYRVASVKLRSISARVVSCRLASIPCPRESLRLQSPPYHMIASLFFAIAQLFRLLFAIPCRVGSSHLLSLPSLINASSFCSLRGRTHPFRFGSSRLPSPPCLFVARLFVSILFGSTPRHLSSHQVTASHIAAMSNHIFSLRLHVSSSPLGALRGCAHAVRFESSAILSRLRPFCSLRLRSPPFLSAAVLIRALPDSAVPSLVFSTQSISIPCQRISVLLRSWPFRCCLLPVRAEPCPFDASQLDPMRILAVSNHLRSSQRRAVSPPFISPLSKADPSLFMALCRVSPPHHAFSVRILAPPLASFPVPLVLAPVPASP